LYQHAYITLRLTLRCVVPSTIKGNVVVWLPQEFSCTRDYVPQSTCSMKYRFVDEDDDDISSAMSQLSLFDAAIGKLMWSELHSLSDIALCCSIYSETFVLLFL